MSCFVPKCTQHREVEMQCQIAHLEKQCSVNQYWYHEMQVRVEEAEAKLDYMALERIRLVSEKLALKAQVDTQIEVRH